MRFGLAQGDLESTEGRKSLLILICRHCPRHIWLSPKCGPWSNWSRFNSGRSLQLWDKIHQERIEMLSQVALCLVLCRHQVRLSRHVHWEQPKGSLMLKLPYLQELDRYMKSAQPDMCTAGELKDPVSHQLLKKGMNIMTSSPTLHSTLDQLKCDRTHSHQVIEGNTIAQGQTIARSAFSELYPRKFARLVAKIILKARFPVEKPFGQVHDPVLCLVDQILAADDRPSKRQRLGSGRFAKSKSADRALDSPEDNKRRRINNKPELIDVDTLDNQKQNQLQKIFQLIEPSLPRVGKKIIEQGEPLEVVQALFPEKHIKALVVCKGTERTLESPKGMNPREAPYRRAIMKSRTDQKIRMEMDWEKYDMLSKRQLVRKSHPCRVNITVFAANPMTESTPASIPSSAAELTSRRDVSSSSSDVQDGSSMIRPEGSSIRSPTKLEPVDAQHDAPDRVTIESVPKDAPRENVQVPMHGPRFLALPKEEQNMLKRAHQNLCHPSHEQFSAVLRAQGARPELTQAIFDMSCPTCAAAMKPKIARPSTIKFELDFNDKVFVDGVTWTNKLGKTFHFYHVLDQATNYHVAMPAPSRAAEDAIRCISEAWLLWAGPPNAMVTDSATEFTSEPFAEFLQRHDIQPTTTAPFAHWQNGRSERHGQILQNMLDKIDSEMPINTYEDLRQSLIQSTHAKNTLSIRKGFSPEVLVFGKSSRVPGSVISCERDSSLASADREDAHGIRFRRSLELREKARVAFHEEDNNMALRRACLRRARPNRKSYLPNEWVMMWQPSQQGGYWFGPLKVVNQENEHSIWATQGGKLHRRAPEHVRPVCSQEARQIPPELTPNEIPNELRSTEERNPEIEVIPTVNPEHNPPLNNHNPLSDSNSQSQEQPDDEPEAATPPESNHGNEIDPAVETPIPEIPSEDDDLVTTHLLCCDDEIMHVDPEETPCAWRFELELPSHLNEENTADWSADEILLATTDKKQRTEVKLSMLNNEEKKAFEEAKKSEIQNWLKTGRPQKDRVIGIEPVPELSKAMQLKSEEICRLDKSAYGLIDAPFLWFQTLQSELIELGFVASPFDPCLFLLRHPKTQKLSEALGVHVDDGIHGGDDYFHQQISKLESKYPFGSKKSRTFTFTGIDLHQNTDNSIELSQSKYVRNINPISMKAERRAQENEPVSEAERHQLRGLIGSLQYAAVHTRPDLSSSLSQLQSQINSATVSTLVSANKALHIAKKHSDVTIKINPISTEDLRFIAFSDASFASKSKPESHSGMIILATHKDISQNKACTISPLSWGTKKIQRVVTSTLSAETTALSTALDQLTWIRLYWAWILRPEINWRKPETINELPEAISIPTIKFDEKDFAITDCKSLYDLTTRTAVPNCQEFRTQLQARAIKDILAEGIQLHWVHSGAQLADALTKTMEASFLRTTLKQGWYCLHDEHEILKDRATARNRLRWLKSSSDEMSSKSEKL
eukprot:s3593_g5.t1